MCCFELSGVQTWIFAHIWNTEKSGRNKTRPLSFTPDMHSESNDEESGRWKKRQCVSLPFLEQLCGAHTFPRVESLTRILRETIFLGDEKHVF